VYIDVPPSIPGFLNVDGIGGSNWLVINRGVAVNIGCLFSIAGILYKV
jgi:hypothetical protein